jgi:hypothetical protein
MTTADELIADVFHDPPARALRISGLYASLFLESSFVCSWCGLAAFVALHVHRVLLGPTLGYRDVMTEGNLQIYRTILPSWLERRAGRTPGGALGPAFERLARAEALLVDDPVAAEAEAEAALLELCVVEQRTVTQPILAPLGRIRKRALAEVFLFRLGLDSAAEIVAFPGDDPARLESRLAWTRNQVLPAWERARAERMEWIRADLDRIRRKAGVRIGVFD